ncbi:MAG: peptide/nickel transport system substrate-binding protein, partial [Parcubacteria group bacterium Greene0714_36]
MTSKGRAKEIYENALRLNRRWRMLSIRKILYLPRILSVQEKRLYIFLFLAGVLSASVFLGRIYAGMTRPVPQVGGSYAEGVIGTPRMINPLYAVKDVDRDIARLVFSGLFTYDGAGGIQPDLAERYEISKDGKTYTVVLREGTAWHDGMPLTADDVVFTVRRIQNAQYKSPLRLNWQGVDAEKIDTRTVRFTLRTAYAPFIENLTQGIIPKHLWEHVDPGAALLHDLNISPVGSGPYRLKRFKNDGEGSLLWYTLSRNPRFHGEGPYLKEITFRFFDNEEDMVSAWRRGDIEGFGPVSRVRANEFSQEVARVAALATPRIFSVFFNERLAPALADKKIRSALSYAIDRERIAEQATTGGGIAMATLLPLSRPMANGALPEQYDPARARKLIESTGWKDADGDGIYEKAATGKKKGEKEIL